MRVGIVRTASLALGLCFALTATTWAAGSQPRGPKSPARVVIVEDPQSIEDFNPRPDVIRQMVESGVKRLTGKAKNVDAWRSLVSPKDRVGLKVFASPGANSGTRKAVVAAVIQQLRDLGVPATNIIVWDRQLLDLRLAGFFELAEQYGVRIASSLDAGYDETKFYDTALLGRLVYGDLEFGRKGNGVGRKSYVSKLVTQEMTKIISITPLLNHNIVGVSGNLYGLAMGSVDNILRFEVDRDRLFTAVPELCALPVLGDRVVLNIVDALVCQYEGGERGLLHYSTTLGQLRFSLDPVALDVLSLQELDRQRRAAKKSEPENYMELYHNASLLEIGVSDPRKIKVERIP